MGKIKNKVILLLFVFLVGFLFVGGFLFAQRIPEVTYPTIPRASPPRTINVPIPSYLRYIYNFAIILAGFLCFTLFIWGGVRYLFSGGSPRLMKIGRDQIIKAGLGLVIIFSSYLILNTINPQLVLFPGFSIQKIPDISLLPSPSPPTQKVMMEELPMGALITSEIGVSSFIRFPTTTDPAYDAPEYDQTFEEVLSYSTLFQEEGKRPTEYQGALHGRRLKRIHEVATTTLPVAHMLVVLSQDLKDMENKLKDTDGELVLEAIKCNCFLNCDRPCDFGLSAIASAILGEPSDPDQITDVSDILGFFEFDIGELLSNIDIMEIIGDFLGCLGGCTPGVCISCEGDPCPGRDKMNALRGEQEQDGVPSIPRFYGDGKDPRYPIPCKIAEIKYLAEHFRRFLDNKDSKLGRPLVKNDKKEEYKNKSYYFSDEAKKLREQIETCINEGQENWQKAGFSDEDFKKVEEQYQEIEELIDLMASVENKGTVSPITDPPQRDVETNINQLEEIYSHLRYIKHILNPHYFPSSVYPTLTLSQFYRVKAELQIKEFPWEILPFNLEPGLRSSDDPATFFRPSTSGFLPRNMPENVVFAQEKEKKTSAPEKEVEVPCHLIAEIPVGKTMDEAIQLTEDILRELKNIYQKGHFIIDSLYEQIELAKKTFELSDDLIDLTSEDECGMCDEECESHCFEISLPTPIGDVDVAHICYCTGMPCPLPEIITRWAQILLATQQINNLYDAILEAKGGNNDALQIQPERTYGIYESFYKLNSVYPEKDPQHPDGHPKAGERVPIGKDLCCKDDDANCREEGELVKDKLEERDYILVEKLIEIKKLLNRTRDFKMFSYYIRELSRILEEFAHSGVADWLVRINTNRHLVDLQEIENVETTQKVGPLIVGGKYSLTDCQLFFEEAQKYYTQAGGSYMLLEDWREAKERAHISYEMCPPDPPLECSYFDSRIFKKRVPLNCYSYDENWFIDYDLASDFYCCVKKE